MAFMISVIKKYDRKPVPENIDNVDEWILEEEEKNTLYMNGLGSDGTVYEYWCSIALDLGLSSIPKIYKYGIELDNRTDIDKLKDELEILKKYWRKLFVNSDVTFKSSESSDGITIEKSYSLLEHLNEQSGYVLDAIKIAQQNDAILSFG